VTENIASTNILSMQIRNGNNLSGTAVRRKGEEIDIIPDDREALKRGNTRYISLTSYDIIVNRQE
ncbi:MAG TPA: RNase P, partial [Methanocella sp.]|nr:RNase P [Methanocella sp.]